MQEPDSWTWNIVCTVERQIEGARTDHKSGEYKQHNKQNFQYSTRQVSQVISELQSED